MTRPAGRAARDKRLGFWPQWAGGLVAVAASLAALSLPGTALADTGYDQMTGVGSTASAVTVPWTQGILDNTNSATGATQSANADRSSANPTSPESFMYPQFKNLVVKVSQTQNISNQGITVSWTGGTPTSGSVQGNFLEMMECWGDASTGPTPEQCEYASRGLNAHLQNTGIGTRGGSFCIVNTPSTTNPPASADGQQPSAGCDPAEAGVAADTAPSCPSTTCGTGDFFVPFSPVSDPTSLDYSTSDTTYFSEFNTNEIQEAVTSSAGTGQQQFETLTGTQAPGLGCGDAESDGSARGCWLVIVPRGTYEPNGFNVNTNIASVPNGYIDTSPLSASNWAMRIQIHLGFSLVGTFCPSGTLERQTFGTGLMGRAMLSWELALNQAAKCTRVYGYSAVPEATSTLNLEPSGNSGLAFTTIPIGSEATRAGESPPANLPNILYAPVAVAAVDFGFNVNQGSAGYVSTPVNLTPLLLAKALTQSYREDLPDYYTEGLPPGVTPTTGSNTVPDLGPSWSLNNPLNISEDKTFQQINPGVPATPGGPEAPLLTEDHSALNQQVWNWIQSSSAATTWLGGTPDASDGNMVLDQDKNYQSLGLGTNTNTDSFPRAYSTCLNLGNFTTATGSVKPVQKCSLDLLPYTNSYQTAASSVLSSNDPDNNGPWDPTATAPDGTNGWWGVLGIEPLGHIWMWGLSDTPDLAAYGLIPADLCNDAANDTASNCVGPTVASVGTAVQSATPDSSGLLEVNPASPGNGGWPLTQIIYAAVPTNQSAAALTDYANLISYAVGSGQITGSTPGDLPPGYLPLPSNLVSKAQAVVTQLQNLASPSPSPSASSSASSTASSSSASAASTTTASSTAAASTSTAAASTSTPAAAAGATGGATPAPAPGTTPNSVAASTPSSGLGQTPAASGSHPVVVPSGSTVPGGAVGNLPPAEAASGSTPEVPVGDVRWALIVVAAVGGAFAGGGTMLRSGMTLPWSRRRPGGGASAPP